MRFVGSLTGRAPGRRPSIGAEVLRDGVRFWVAAALLLAPAPGDGLA